MQIKFKEYYDNVNHLETCAQKVGWKNQHAQEIRFVKLLEILPFDENFTINDLGCGLADLYFFVKKNNLNCEKYNGYDVLDNMVNEANMRLKGVNNISINLIDTANEMINADYTLASGIFNLKNNISIKDWEDYVTNTLHFMWEKSSKGIAFNMLTSYSDKEYQKESLYYANPEFYFNYCINNFSKNISLAHDYKQYDFTIKVLK